ncbi:MAG: TonB-dependent receptor plug domain-containing protein, partial [Alphaproteobacteria bacterium]|nr:TonB-dependent receptor plug domain-containing protein [Alphaproteobacteria bacterium]
MTDVSAPRAGAIATRFAFSITALALAVAIPGDGRAQTSPAPADPSVLPPVQIDAPAEKPRRKPAQATNRGPRSAARTAQRNPQPAATPAPTLASTTRAQTQDTATGTAGVYANSTAVATKVNTPVINIPQSVSVVTRNFIADQNFQSVTDVTRYVPGVAVHQGEGNRDELVIRGVDSSANFFVNGFRDDVQIYRDLYNTQSIEVLKGPSALTFGRGSGGGLVNRTLKEADWSNVKEVTVQTGSSKDRRVAVDVDQAINPNVAARINAVYEARDTFRRYGWLERWGINPTLTLLPNDTTKVKLSFETFHDARTSDRGNPSQAVINAAPTAANAAFLRAN